MLGVFGPAGVPLLGRPRAAPGTFLGALGHGPGLALTRGRRTAEGPQTPYRNIVYKTFSHTHTHLHRRFGPPLVQRLRARAATSLFALSQAA